MTEILTRALGFIIIIFAGYLFKKRGIITLSESKVISKIIMNITLPAALASGFQGVVINSTLISMIFLGIVTNIIMLFVGFIVSKRKSSMDKVFYMINSSSYNIGNFTIPFAQAFFPSTTLAALCLFDMGNGMMCLGISFAVVSAIVNKNSKFSLSNFLKILTSSPSFMTYIIMFIITSIGIYLPNSAYSIIKLFGNANTFLAMFLIGIIFEINIDFENAKKIFKIIFIRYIGSIVFACIIFFILPFSKDIKTIINMAVFSPILSIAPIYCQRLGGDYSLAGVINSICIVCSLIAMTTILILFI